MWQSKACTSLGEQINGYPGTRILDAFREFLDSIRCGQYALKRIDFLFLAVDSQFNTLEKNQVCTLDSDQLRGLINLLHCEQINMCKRASGL